MKTYLLILVLPLSFASLSLAQGSRNLQIHFIDVGQGDGAILISPQGETVLFDNGIPGHCDLPLSYLQQLGITAMNYQVASHYHDDHIGCTSEVLMTYPLRVAAYDRGRTYFGGLYDKYLKAVEGKRKEAFPGEKITLDAPQIIYIFEGMDMILKATPLLICHCGYHFHLLSKENYQTMSILEPAPTIKG